MKTNSHQSKVNGYRWRSLVILFAFVSLLSVAGTLGLSQVKNQKRVTALQLGDSPEGARVTIVSDAALNDYEAFRRGDRFYVKIPLADLSAANPGFNGNGFDDVRVQKVGDSVIVSFKLQAGATARVDQRSNRLDVIFSTLGMSRSVAPVNVAKNYPTSRNRRNASQSEAVAGPMPPMSSTPSAPSTAPRETRRADYREVESDPVSGTYRDGARAARSNRRGVGQSSSAQDNKRGATSANYASPNSTSTNSAATMTTPQPTPYSSTGAATNAATPGSTTATNPYGVPVSTPSTNPYGVPVSTTSKTVEASSWESRIKFLKAWAKLNRSALIIGGIVALILLAGFLFWAFWSRKGRGTAKAKPPVKDGKKSKVEKVVGRTVVEAPAPVAPVAKAPLASAPVARTEAWRPKPAAAGFPAAPLRNPRETDQDREVFEL